jgi:hypothetical protein
LDAGLVFSLSLRGVSSDNDFDKTMGAASLTWQF